MVMLPNGLLSFDPEYSLKETSKHLSVITDEDKLSFLINRGI
jgi:hypothetical protein